MRKNRWIAVLTASALLASQLSTAAWAVELNTGSVAVQPDVAYQMTEDGSEAIEGRETSSVTVTEGGTGVYVTDQAVEEKKDSTFTVDGNVTVNESDTEDPPEGEGYDGDPVTGIEASVSGGESGAASTELNVTGNVSAATTKQEYADAVGIDVHAAGADATDQSLTINVQGEVKAENTSEKTNSVTGINIVTSPDESNWEDYDLEDPWYDDGGDEGDGTGETQGADAGTETAASHTMTTKVTAGSVTADAGAEGDAIGVSI